MQKILGYMRKAIKEYNLINNNDRICVGISGGKDSLVMVRGLSLLKRFIGIDYEIVCITIDPRFNNTDGDYSAVSKFCAECNIEYHIVPTHISEIVFDVRKESNPCSLCSRMRRGAIYNTAVEFGCNKIALGHNYDDAVETFIMNLFTEGRIGCFSPASYMEDKNIHIIRPLVLAPEREIKKTAMKNNFPVIESLCPADGHTNRQQTKNFIADMERKNHGFKNRIFGAMQRADIDGWGVK